MLRLAKYSIQLGRFLIADILHESPELELWSPLYYLEVTDNFARLLPADYLPDEQPDKYWAVLKTQTKALKPRIIEYEDLRILMNATRVTFTSRSTTPRKRGRPRKYLPDWL